MNNKKTIVITGATSGMGYLLTENFAKLGYKIFAGFRNEALKAKLQAISPDVIPFYIDMTKENTISEATKLILSKTEKIDTLINGAGCVVAGPMETLDTKKIKEQFDVNTFSHLQFTQALFSKLSGAKIINISSMASFGIFPFVAPYCASKRALDILFNSLQIECGNCIKVISIKPGVIKTPLWEKSIEKNKDVLGDNKKYIKEFNFLMKNAKENETKGLNPMKVVNLILKIDKIKNPKTSYCVGFDAKIAEIFSKLPQGFINKTVRKFLTLRVNKNCEL